MSDRECRVRLAWLIKRRFCRLLKVFSRILEKDAPWKASLSFYLKPEKLARLFVMRQVKPSHDRTALFHYGILANLENRLFSETSSVRSKRFQSLLLSSQLSRRTRAETFATQARKRDWTIFQGF